MQLLIVRLLLVLAAIAFWVDGYLIHPYTWPLQTPWIGRLILVLFTHSRTGTDTWGILACLLLALCLRRW